MLPGLQNPNKSGSHEYSHVHAHVLLLELGSYVYLF